MDELSLEFWKISMNWKLYFLWDDVLELLKYLLLNIKDWYPEEASETLEYNVDLILEMIEDGE